MHDGIVVCTTATIYATLDNAPDKQRARRLGPEDHLGGTAEQSIAERVEDEGVQAIDGRNVGQVVGEGEGHRQVHASNGEGGYEVALDKRQLVLAHPYQAGQVVGQVPAFGEERTATSVVGNSN